MQSYTKYLILPNIFITFFFKKVVPHVGLEPTHPEICAPKAHVSTIPPMGHLYFWWDLNPQSLWATRFKLVVYTSSTTEACVHLE